MAESYPLIARPSLCGAHFSREPGRSARGCGRRAPVGMAATAEWSAPRLRVPLFDSGDATLAERVDDELAAGFGE